MDIDDVVESLVDFGECDWIPLWMIVQDVEDQLEVDDPAEVLDLTIATIRKLLERGFIAGDAPGLGDFGFSAWPNQDPLFIADHLRGLWARHGGVGSWGDGPWFASLSMACPRRRGN